MAKQFKRNKLKEHEKFYEESIRMFIIRLWFNEDTKKM